MASYLSALIWPSAYFLLGLCRQFFAHCVGQWSRYHWRLSTLKRTPNHQSKHNCYKRKTRVENTIDRFTFSNQPIQLLVDLHDYLNQLPAEPCFSSFSSSPTKPWRHFYEGFSYHLLSDLIFVFHTKIVVRLLRTGKQKTESYFFHFLKGLFFGRRERIFKKDLSCILYVYLMMKASGEIFARWPDFGISGRIGNNSRRQHCPAVCCCVCEWAVLYASV